MTAAEEWRPVVGYEGWYEVSDQGNVRSAKTGQLKSQRLNWQGYRRVGLYKNQRVATRPVHILVAEAFIGPRIAGIEVNHKDGVVSNNKLSNLEYVTPEENRQHAIEMGLYRKNRPMKLTDADVERIRRDAQSMPQTALAARHGVSVSHVRQIVFGSSRIRSYPTVAD